MMYIQGAVIWQKFPPPLAPAHLRPKERHIYAAAKNTRPEDVQLRLEHNPDVIVGRVVNIVASGKENTSRLIITAAINPDFVDKVDQYQWFSPGYKFTHKKGAESVLQLIEVSVLAEPGLELTKWHKIFTTSEAGATTSGNDDEDFVARVLHVQGTMDDSNDASDDGSQQGNTPGADSCYTVLSVCGSKCVGTTDTMHTTRFYGNYRDCLSC